MILALVCVCQLAAARGEMVIRAGEAAAKVRISVSHGTSYVGLSTLQSMGASFRRLPNGRAILDLAGVQFELGHGIPFVRVADRVVPLAGAPRFYNDSVAIPVQLVAQVLPRFAPTVRYNVASRTLSMVPVVAATRTAPAVVAPVVSEGAKPAAPPTRRIIVDAGHGGPDEGTHITLRNGTRVTEKSITLSVATLLGDELKKRGFEVVYTRSSDTLIALHDRGKIANASQGAAFVSIHVNSVASARNAGARGVETYFLSVARTEDARRLQTLENESVRFESDSARTGPGGDPVSFILSDMQQNDHLRESSELAQRIQGALSRAHPGGDRGVKQAEFAVLVGSFMPSILVEVGFLSNQSDAAFLQKKENQKKMAVAMADAMATYFKGYERRIIATGAGK